MQNLFSAPVVIDELGSHEKKYHLKAEKQELPEIAAILRVPEVKNLEAEICLKLNKKTHRLDVFGRVSALMRLTSVISLEDFEREYVNDFELVYDTKATPEEIKLLDLELDLYDETPEPLPQGKLNLADVALEQIALVMEDNPRQPGETFAFKSEFDEETTAAQNPFSVLKKIKK